MNGPVCCCGQVFCHKEDHGYFLRRKRTGPHLRARVFWWRSRGVWTWHPVINGEDIDAGHLMGHYRSQARAFADALAYTHGRYPTTTTTTTDEVTA